MWTVTLEEDGDDLILPLPQEIMDHLNLKVGDNLKFEVDETHKIILLSKGDSNEQ